MTERIKVILDYPHNFIFIIRLIFPRTTISAFQVLSFLSNKCRCTISFGPELAYGSLRVKIGPIYVEILALEIISTDLDLEDIRLKISDFSC